MNNQTCIILKGRYLSREYIEQSNGGYYVAGSRVSLASIVYEFRDGASPETIRQNFPTLSLEQVYGAITFYLGHVNEVNDYLRELEQTWEKIEAQAKPADPELHRRIQEARRRQLTKPV